MIDTNPFITKYQKESDKYLGINDQDHAKQIAWIHEKLSVKNEKIKWRIVVGHHPLYSGGKRKESKDTQEIDQLLSPILAQYQVDAYITGHEHDLQIIKKPNTKVTQYLSGAGSELRETGTTTGTLFAESVPGFMAFTLTKNQLTAYVIQSNKTDFDVI